MGESLQEIIDRLWIAPKHAEWTPRTDVVALKDLRRWLTDEDIEIVGFAHHLIDDHRFRIEPALEVNEYKDFVKQYFERCLREDPQGDWADSRYSAGHTMVNTFAALWGDSSVPRPLLKELKDWLGKLYKEGDEKIRNCLVTATLEHLFEQKDIRRFFADWQKDEVLATAYREACEWYQGGGNSPLGKPEVIRRKS